MKNLRALLFALLLTPGVSGAVLYPLGFSLALVTGITATSLILPLVGASIIVGGAIAFIGMGSDGASPASAPVIVHINPSAAQPTPAGWTAPVAPATAPVPPPTAGAPVLTVFSLRDSGVPFSSVSAACTSAAEFHAGDGLKTYTINSVTSSTCALNEFVNGVFSQIVNIALTINSVCPAGYTNSSGTCVLQNAALVKKPEDSRCFVTRSANTFAFDVNDPDCVSLPSAVTVTASSVSVQVTPEHKQVVTINADGSVTAQKIVIDPIANTTTTETTTASAPNGTAPGGKITGTGTVTASGQGTQQDTTSLKLPTDYNREATQQSILTKLGEIKDKRIDETGTPTDGSLQSQKDAFDASVTAQTNEQNALLTTTRKTDLGVSFGMSFPTVACVDPSFAIPKTGKNLVIPLCDKRDDVNAVLSWMMALLTGLYFFRLIYNVG